MVPCGCRLGVYPILLSLCVSALAQFVTKGTSVAIANYNQILADRAGLLTNCDGSSTLFCGPGLGTCYTGVNNYIGCCSVSKCVIRTTCYNFDQVSLVRCDFNTGGCVLCTDSSLPFCNYFTNVRDNQHAIYCGSSQTNITVAYQNIVTTGSTAGFPAKTSATTTTSNSVGSTANPGATAADPLASSTSSSASGGVSISNNGVSGGAIAGIVIGAMALGALAVGAIWYLRRKRAYGRSMSGDSLEPPTSNEHHHLYCYDDHTKAHEMPGIGHDLHEADDPSSWTDSIPHSTVSDTERCMNDKSLARSSTAPLCDAELELPADNIYSSIKANPTGAHVETELKHLEIPNPSTVSSTTTAVNTPALKGGQVSDYSEQSYSEKGEEHGQRHGLGIGIRDSDVVQRHSPVALGPSSDYTTRPFSLSSTGWTEGERWVSPEEALLTGLNSPRPSW